MSYSFKNYIDFFLSIILNRDTYQTGKKKPPLKFLILNFLVKFIVAYQTSKRSTISKCDQNNRLHSTNSQFLPRRFPNLI